MPLSKEIKDRIEKDASDKYGPMSRGYMPYMVGATAEAERAQGLVEAMQKIRKQPLKINDVWIIIDETLTKYNNPK